MAKIETLRARTSTDAAPPARSPARQALADAIERRADARAAVVRFESALERASAHWNAIDGEIAAARDAVERRRDDEPHRLAAALLDGAAADTGSDLRTAEAALASITADERTRESAYHIIKNELANARTAASRADDAVTRALRAALKADPAVAALVGEFEATRQRLGDLQGAMLALGASSGLPDAAEGWQAQRAIPSPSQSNWHGAIERLRTDADAPLPGVTVGRAEPDAA